jgi:hypothetical protein
MEHKIDWESEMEAALTRSQNEKKPVILDFFNPG